MSVKTINVLLHIYCVPDVHMTVYLVMGGKKGQQKVFTLL
jgi:hypothetical protein